MKAIIVSNKHSFLSKHVISAPKLSSIIDQIYLKRKGDLPIFSGAECSNYYSQSIAHSWVSGKKNKITTLLQIPIAKLHHTYFLRTLTQKNQLHADLPLAIINPSMNQYRFLSLSEYKNCLVSENTLICRKRTIEISPILGCNLKKIIATSGLLMQFTTSAILKFYSV